jgi:hypothetical protein
VPRLSCAAWVLWIAVIAAQLALVCVMLARRAVRRWPATCTFLAFRCTVSLFLVAIVLTVSQPRLAALYFYVYWAADAAACFIRVWMIVEMGCSACAAAPGVHPLVRRIIPAIAALSLAMSIILAGSAKNIYWDLMERATVSFERILALTWMATFLVMAYVCDFLGMRWGRCDRNLAIGFTVQAASTTVISWLLGTVPNVLRLSNLQDVLYLTSLLFWARALLQHDEDCSMTIETLKSLSEPYLKLGKKLRVQ